MNKGDSEKRTEIWLKYCEECVKSKLETNDETVNNSLGNPSKKVNS